LISPILNKVLNFSKVLLILILLIKLILFNLGMSLNQVKKMITESKKVMIVPLLLLFALPQMIRAEIPSDTMLKELQTRLQKEQTEAKVDCFPNCVSMVKGAVTVGKKQITIQLDFDSFSDLHIPLPQYKQWYPKSISVNNKKGILRFDNAKEKASLLLSKGKNRVVIKGTVFGNSLQLSFPFEIHNLKVNAGAWSVSGLVEGNVPGGTIQFDKQVKQAVSESDDTFLPDPIDPFLEISRTIILRNDWEVYTTARRIVPHEGPINLSIPLIAGESVITENVRVSDKKVEITMGGFQTEFSWRSRLKKEDKIVLKTPKHLEWRETWSVDASAKWHIETSGLAKLKLQNRQSPVWKPRPGEKLTIAVSKPKAVTGNTKTIESAMLDYKPGASSGKVVLTLGINSSIGDSIKIKLPKEALLDKMIIDSVERIISNKNGEITLPLHPGKQTVALHWKEMSPFSFMKRTPLINLNGKTSNIDIKFAVPRSRWVLFVGGPPIGPAMLIWGLMIVLLIVAFILGRFKSLPIKSYEWALLFIGMGTVANYGVALIVIWFIAMAKRASYKNKLSSSTFNFMQLVLLFLTLSAVISLLFTIPMGLLSTPDMQIVGNGSSSYLLHWYQ
ncbi:hypothetical protein KAH37_07620, partial [bacterium]|nr:hypothetical protein [bacterium]